MKIAAGILSRSTASPFPKPAGKKDDAKGAKEPKKGVRRASFVMYNLKLWIVNGCVINSQRQWSDLKCNEAMNVHANF